ncbi:FtsQ-type POTRA domain-containing protein [Candidatus Woesearchaeota archaeon]|nr:FtsQ-type POTRA domain-containing protein [Candidatus Woesearchaeota archaeon]
MRRPATRDNTYYRRSFSVPWLRLSLLAVLISGVYFKKDAWMASLSVQNIRIEGDINHINPAEVGKHLQHFTGKASLAVDLPAMEKELGQCAWVDSVEVSRIWPDTIRVRIVEQKPVAIWGNNGFLNTRGKVFFPGSLKTHADLPRLQGPAGSEKRLLTLLYGLNRAWRPRGMKVARLTLSERLAWFVAFDSGLEIVFGKQDPLEMTGKLEKILPVLGEQRLSQLAGLDLRYANGLALRWKPEAIPSTDTGTHPSASGHGSE